MLLYLIFLSALLFSPPTFAFPQETSVQTYDQLVSAIREVRHASQQRIERTVEQEKVREAWETGKLIQEHILLNQERAEYGQEVMVRLGKDLGISKTELNYMREFVRTYPSIDRVPGQLPWSHIQTLLSINDEKERQAVAEKARENQWTQDDLRDEVRRRTGPSASRLPLPALPEIKPGKIGAMTLREINGKKYYDLGFSIYVEVKGKTPEQNNSQAGELYTYNAEVAEIIDGDTFHARIDLGLGTMTKQGLRLRRLDAPELVSAEGKQARAVLEKILMRDKGRIVIKTSKGDDQFGRYLVDIWISGKSIEQDLLDSGFFEIRTDV